MCDWKLIWMHFKVSQIVEFKFILDFSVNRVWTLYTKVQWNINRN